MKSAIVIPCYNEEKRLCSDSFKNFLSNQHHVHLIFVDDGSTDNTLKILKSIHQLYPDNTEVLHLKENSGKAEAVRRGMLLALSKKTDLVGFWDADLSTPLEEISRFVAAFSRNPEIKWVFGSRVKLLGRKIKRNVWRHYAGRFFATCVSFLLDLPIYDSQCGAKMFKVNEKLKLIFSEKFKSKWLFDVELIAHLQRDHRQTGQHSPDTSIYEIPLNTWKDVKGSKLKITDFFMAVFDLFKIWRLLRT